MNAEESLQSIEYRFTECIDFHRRGAQHRRRKTLIKQRFLIYSIPVLSVFITFKQLIPDEWFKNFFPEIQVDFISLTLGLLIVICSFVMKSYRPNDKILECDKAINDFSHIYEYYFIAKERIKIRVEDKRKRDLEILDLIENLNSILRDKILNFNMDYDKIKLDQLENLINEYKK